MPSWEVRVKFELFIIVYWSISWNCIGEVMGRIVIYFPCPWRSTRSFHNAVISLPILSYFLWFPGIIQPWLFAFIFIFRPLHQPAPLLYLFVLNYSHILGPPTFLKLNSIFPPTWLPEIIQIHTYTRNKEEKVKLFRALISIPVACFA